MQGRSCSLLRSGVQTWRRLPRFDRTHPSCGGEGNSGPGSNIGALGNSWTTSNSSMGISEPPSLVPRGSPLPSSESPHLCSTFTAQISEAFRSSCSQAEERDMFSPTVWKRLVLPAVRYCSTSPELDASVAMARSSEAWIFRFERMRIATEARREFAESLEVAEPDEEITSKITSTMACVSAQVDTSVEDAIPELMLIHPTAILHPGALLGEGVEIGAHCTVGPQVKLGNECKLHAGSHVFGQTELGEKCVLLSGAVVGADIPGRTVIGDNNIIGHHAVVGVKCQDMKYKEGDECFLYIGNNNDIREFVSIHLSSKSSDKTILGNNNLIMGSCHIAHDCKIGNRNILANNTLLGGHVLMEDLVHTGGAVAVHQFCNIGSYSFLAGGSMVDRDVPMFMMVAGDRAELRGLNLEGMRRCGFSEIEIRSIRRVYQKLFMNSDSNAGGLEERLSAMELNDELLNVLAVKMMLQSVRDCFGENRRGICRFRHWTAV